MPSPRWTKVARDLWLHRARTLLAVLAIAVGIAGAGSVLDTWALLREVTRAGYLATNPASATILLDEVDLALLRAVRAHPGVRHAERRRTVVASVRTGEAWRTALLFASDGPASQRIGVLARERGEWPPADGALVVERSSVEFAGVAVGDAVAVRVGDEDPLTLPIVGVARDAGLAPGWMEHVVYGFVTPATLARLGAPSSLDELRIVVRDGAMDREAIRRLANDVAALATRQGRRVREIDVPPPGEHVHAAQMDSLLFTQGAFGVLALLLSGFLVLNLMTALLAGQVREIGVMKALGARNGQIAAMYLVLALALGLAACLVAMPLAAVAGRRYAEFAAEMLNFRVDGAAIPRFAFALQLAVGVLLPVAAAALPVARGCRIPVGTALRDVGLVGGDAGPGWLRHASGIARPLLLSLRNAFRRRQRMALTLCALAAGGAVFLGALNLRASIRGSVDHLFGTVLRYDLVLRLAAPHDAARIEQAVAAAAGAEQVEAWGATRAAVAGPGALRGTFAVAALPPRSRLVAFPVAAGRWLRDDDERAIVVSRRLLHDEPSLAVGREATLLIDGRPSRWTVVGTVESGPASSAYVARDALARARGDARVTSVVVRAASRSVGAHSELGRRLRDRLAAAGLPVASSQLVQAGRLATEDHLLMVAGFLVFMAQLTIVVGGLGLASTMSLAVLERTREIGVMRALGASPRAILTMVQVEGLVISVLGWLVAIPLSVPMSVLVGWAFGRIMLPVPLTLVPEWSGVALWLAVALVTSVVACAWPARRATRLRVAEALAYE
jgi:putative ABC transport system permease protein